MIVRRSKLFASPSTTSDSLYQSPVSPQPQKTSQEIITQQVSSRDLAVQNMKLQQQMILNNRMRQKLQADERKNRMQALSEAQKVEAKKDATEKTNQTRMAKAQVEDQTPAERNWASIRQRSKPTAPVPMGK